MNLELVRSRMVSFLQKIIFPIKGSVLTIIFILLLSNPLNSALAQEPSLFTVGAGAFDIFDDETTAEFRMEYTFPEAQKVGIFTP
ncbi:MAG: hypothetical protein CMM27_01785, partial [Rhodospirillaceae bacterium]|nr:hypothetical protein [Rhodospirillaceae bacterium]